MKMKKINPVILLAVISFILISTDFTIKQNLEYQSSINVNFNQIYPNAAANHDPILIDGNAELATFISDEEISGDGTESSPYIIEDFSIDTETGNGIDIRNTNAYLIIQDCRISGDNLEYSGIYLNNTAFIRIYDNIILKNDIGINLDYNNNNNVLIGNYIASNGIGIHMMGSNIAINITENIVMSNVEYGIRLGDYSINNTIYYNDFYRVDNTSVLAHENENCHDNQWDNGTTGNYWEDYTTKYPSATNDGNFWDTPYEIDGDGPGIDNFPLVDSVNPIPVIKGFPIVNIIILISIGVFILKRKINLQRIRK